MQGLGVGPAGAAGPVSAGLTITPTDLNFILKQIQIAEAHATYEGATPGTVRPPNSVLSTTGSDGSANAPHVVNFTLPHGLRTVDGRGNNLTVLTDADQQRVPTSPALAKDLGAADRKFPRMVPLADITWKDTEAGCGWCGHHLRDPGDGLCRTPPRGSSATSSPTSRTATRQRWRRPGSIAAPTCPSTYVQLHPQPGAQQRPGCAVELDVHAVRPVLRPRPGPRRQVRHRGCRRPAALQMIRCTSAGEPDQLHHRQPDDPRSGARRHQHHDAVDRPEPDLRLARPRSRCSCVSTSLDGAGKPQSNGRLLDGVGGNIGNLGRGQGAGRQRSWASSWWTRTSQLSRCCSPTSTAGSCVGPTASRRW